MPRAYSIDLRERVLAACEAGEGSQARIAERYRVGERTLSGWLKAAREEGRRAPKPLGGGPKPVGGGGPPRCPPGRGGDPPRPPRGPPTGGGPPGGPGPPPRPWGGPGGPRAGGE